MKYDWNSSLGMMSAGTANQECRKLGLRGEKASEYQRRRAREIYKEEGIKRHYFSESDAERLQ